MAAFDDLLNLQAHDIAADRLRHRRDTLPERARLAEAQATGAAIEARLADARRRRDEVLREERRLDDEATGLSAKARAEEKRMYSGTVSSPRELQAMQADIDQLRRHARELEDAELEVLERREALDTEVADLEAEAGATAVGIGALEAAIVAAETEIDAELATETDARGQVAPGVPAEVLDLYERTRAKNRGTGAARLTGASCGACHLSLPAIEVDRIRHLPPESVACCDHCGAILVR
ncbi:MAG: zinc ribbon domain-containing protein [Acidimicrobiia bacterium]